MAVPMKATLEKIPGGMLLVPLLLGSLLGTFAPGTAQFFGSFTGALFTGGTTILAVFYVCMGASIDIKSTPYILKKGAVLLGSKILFAIVIGLVAGRLLGELPISGGFFAGISTLALVAAFNELVPAEVAA
jgi:2-keto-3-deoxygluconate permease